MKINEINNVLSIATVMESSGPQSNDLLFESAAEMIRNIHDIFASGKNPAESIGEKWDVPHVARFCSALEKIERVVSKQMSTNTLQPNLRDTVFSVLAISDFDHSSAIEKIIKQSNGQEARVTYWTELMNSSDKTKLQSELARIARDLSTLVSMMRTNGAREVAPPTVEPQVQPTF